MSAMLGRLEVRIPSYLTLEPSSIIPVKQTALLVCPGIWKCQMELDLRCFDR